MARTTSGEHERRICALVSGYARGNEIPFESPKANTFVLCLPGEQRQRTVVLIAVGARAVSVNAFVIRRPDENHVAFYRRLLERNRRLYGVAYCLDGIGDVYVTGRMPLASFDEAELDRVLGSISIACDSAFNELLELGFAEAIRREWRWRLIRGESTENLTAFENLAPASSAQLRQDDAHEL